MNMVLHFLRYELISTSLFLSSACYLLCAPCQTIDKTASEASPRASDKQPKASENKYKISDSCQGWVMISHDICPSKWADFCQYRDMSLLFHGLTGDPCGVSKLILKTKLNSFLLSDRASLQSLQAILAPILVL